MATEQLRRRALFLDRDGVINIDHGYVHSIDRFEFIAGIFTLARFATNELGWPVVVTTNQSGIGRGYFDEAQYQALTHWMSECFRAEGAALTKVYHCPFHPKFGVGSYRSDHDWRKPKPGMFLQAATDLALDLGASVAIGDKTSDIEAAAAAGIERRIRLDVRGSQSSGPACRVARDLAQALSILRQWAAE
jgi:D-glycero-D-manno-heptose 1,7-bisphosphate phosphatase